ncbi:hypothetical protein K435DRAFT_838607 [Dendrothele bispora CBS 962.96]|uniref:Uncharacterized protein n=1 Tax=Dendrothele bispora (strain CBS 962.96) TaxID=1314807 RepID=A0A4S8M5F4_DENBC|nr:hypothetical protein K435DRAFT_838607 [Dendrothele bispora CBS 962.96]
MPDSIPQMRVPPARTANPTPLLITAVQIVTRTIVITMTKTFCEVWKKDLTSIDVASNGFGMVYARPHQERIGRNMNKSVVLSWNRTTSGRFGRMVLGVLNGWPDPQSGNFDFITPIISRKIDLHSNNLCTPEFNSSPSPATRDTRDTSVHMRLAIVLWKTLLATRRVKYPQNPSAVNCEIPTLIPKWWNILSELVKDNCIIDNHSWDQFHVEKKRRGHTCMENLPRKEMWSTWITVQALIGTTMPLNIPLNDENCPECLKLHERPFGRSEFVKPHVLALWYLTRNTCAQFHHLCAYPEDIWDSPSIYLHYTSHYKVLDLGKSLFNHATLRKLNEWLTVIWSSSNDASTDSTLRKHVGKNLDPTCFWIKFRLNRNENDLEPHWTETQTAISKISSSEYNVGSELDPVEPASWVTAVVLFTLTKIFGLGPLTAQKLVDVTDTCYFDGLFNKTPPLFNTPASKNFHEALKRSGHTCWPEKPWGPNPLTNLYFSAYSLLLDTSNVPAVGCEEREHRTKCAACHANCAFHDLSLVLDDELLGSLQSLSDKDKKGRVKRLIRNLNSPRYQKNLNGFDPLPLNHGDLITLTKKLDSLSNLFQYALDNGKEMDLFDPNDTISLGYGPNIKYSHDCDSESTLEDELQSLSCLTIPIAKPPSMASHSETETETLTSQQFHNSSPNSHQPIVPANTSYEYRSPSLTISGSQKQNNVYAADQISYHAPLPVSFNHLPPLPGSMPQSVPTSLGPQVYPSLQDQSPPVQLLNSLHCNVSPQDATLPGKRALGSSIHLNLSQSTPGEINLHQPENTDLFQQSLPFNLQAGGTYTSTFMLEAGKGHTPKALNGLRVDDMRIKIKEQFLLMLRSHNIDTGDKLPWRNLFKTLEEHKCQFENWPEGIPQPHTQNGIEKAPQNEIKAIYKALCNKEHPLGICRNDGLGCSGGPDLRFVLQDPMVSGSGTKRGRDEQQGEMEERERNRRRTVSSRC